MKRYNLKQHEVPLWLNGTTSLRIPVRPQPELTALYLGMWRWKAWDLELNDLERVLIEDCPYPVGSELALTETWAVCYLWFPYEDIVYYKVSTGAEEGRFINWLSPCRMPAEFSRFPRRVAQNGVGRLQDITYSGIVASGYKPFGSPIGDSIESFDWYIAMWDARWPQYPWTSNPWGWVLTLEEL